MRENRRTMARLRRGTADDSARRARRQAVTENEKRTSKRMRRERKTLYCRDIGYFGVDGGHNGSRWAVHGRVTSMGTIKWNLTPTVAVIRF